MPAPADGARAWAWVRFFLEEYLPRHRGSSSQTVQSYRTAFRQLLTFLRHKLGPGPAHRLELEQLDSGLVLEYLGWLESSEGPGVGAATRNLRLAALKSFFRCLELYGRPQERGHWERLRHLPQKRAARPSVDHLELREIDQVFSLLNPGNPDGYRDLTLMTVLTTPAPGPRSWPPFAARTCFWTSRHPFVYGAKAGASGDVRSGLSR